MIERRETLTSREYEIHQWEIENRDVQLEHAKIMKDKDIEVLKLEARINSWFKIPITIIKLPVYTLLACAYIACAIRKYEPPEEFWKLLK